MSTMKSHGWAHVIFLAAVSSGCGGEIDGSSSVITPNGEHGQIEELYGATASSRSGLAASGPWILGQRDSWGSTSMTEVRFEPDGRLEAKALDSELVMDDVNGDRYEPVLTRLRGVQRRDCTIGERWRQLDERRFGVLFRCTDGIGREAVFGVSRPFTSGPPPGSHISLTLESVGGESVTAAGRPGTWSFYVFELTLE